eukprot:5473751-Prymnesium_polylepis.1
MVRRIDKHSASQLCQFVGEPVINYNLYPEARTTSKRGSVSRVNAPTMDFYSIRKLESARETSFKIDTTRMAGNMLAVS